MQMKRHGDKSEFAHKRASDLIEAYRRYVRTHDRIVMREVFHTIVEEPASRFYISPDTAVVVVRKMLKGEEGRVVRPLKAEMYREITERVRLYRKRKPGTSLMDAVRYVVESPAPKFYITPNSAKVIFYKEWRRWTWRRLKGL